MEHRRGEHVFEIAAEGSNRNLADALKIILKSNLHRIRTPRFDAGIVHADAVGCRGSGQFRIGQRQATGVLIEIGPTHRLVNRATRDQIFGQIIADVEARKIAEVFLLRTLTAVKVGEFRNRQGIRERRAAGGIGDRRRLNQDRRRDPIHSRAGEDNVSIGVPLRDDFAAGIPTIVPRRIIEKAKCGDVGLLRPDSADDLHPPAEKR